MKSREPRPTSSTTQASRVQTKRVTWPDAAKGIAILLVVLGHVLRGLPEGISASHAWIWSLDAWIYSFHMALFFFISGMFAENAVAKSPQTFLADKARTLIYPYFVWSILQELLRVVAGIIPATGLWRIVYEPVMQFWFLYVLFLALLIHYFLRKLGLPRMGVALFFCLLFGAAVGGIPLGNWGVIYMLALNGVFFAAGFTLALGGSERLTNFQPAALRGVAAVALLLVLALVAWNEPSALFGIQPLPGLAGVFALVALCRMPIAGGLGRGLEFLGRESLGIFVAHTIFSAVTREVLLKAGFTSFWLHLLCGCLVGIAGPLILVALAKRLALPIFALPAPRRK